MANNTISIITPSFNQGQFIEQTIKSVLNQTGNFFIDYIIADGGSTDNTVEIIKKYDNLIKSKNYPIRCKGIEFRWWSKEDKGQSDAINQGFKLAKGEILAWVNSDDYYEPDIFETIIQIFRQNQKIDFIYGDGYIINNNEKLRKEARGLNAEVDGKNKIIQPSTFFTKRVLDKVGLLDENLHYAMDYDLWIRIFQNAETFYLSEILSNFRIWEHSKSSSQQNRFFKERKKIARKYGGNLFDPIEIYKMRSHIPFLNYFNKKFNKSYCYLKKIFYFFVKRIRYNKNQK